tara:strand:+ start:308 stop:1030 length:723 start_codon:yes stop_codon:yes gene_type:complete
MMHFEHTLIQGTLLKRYKRFLADILLENGEEVVAHCANSGSMLGLKNEGSTVYLSPNTNPKAKLDWRWEMIEVDGTLVGINTSRPNSIVEAAILDGTITELTGYEVLRREVKYGGNSRIDILLSSPSNGEATDNCYVEVKSVTLKSGKQALFPDAVTALGTKHLRELMDMVKEGHRAVMVYLVQRSDCTSFNTAAEIDPAYTSALREAQAAGVELLCYQCHLTPEEIKVIGRLPIELSND